jgi:hypothetical protein
MGRAWRLRAEPIEMARRPDLRRAGRTSPMSYGFSNCEYVADLEVTARRILSRIEREIWKYHAIERLDWRACLPLITRELGRNIDRGTFFHAVYRMEQQLGRAWLDLRLWPRDYFCGAWYVVDGLLATKHGPGVTSGGGTNHTVLDSRPPGWDNRPEIGPEWPGSFPGSGPGIPRAKRANHPLSDRERSLGERIDAWMVT